MLTTSSPSPSTQVVSISVESALDRAVLQLQSGRISLNDLDSSIKGKKTTNNSSTGSFEEAYIDELARVSASLSASAHTIESKVRALLLHADALAKSSTPGSDLSKDLRSQAKTLSGELLCLHEQIGLDAKEFRRVAALADQRLCTGRDFIDMAESRFESSPWYIDKVSGIIVVLLSDLYSVIREIEKKGESNDEKKWVAPTSFERVTTKYWVSDERLYEVLLSSVQDLPILIYGRKGERILNQKEVRSTYSSPSLTDNALWSSFVTSVSSVYFDSEDMNMYSKRLKRSEGSKLFRIRWYGSKPRGEKNVFLELKTHHEQWIGDKSVKERCPIQEQDVFELLDRSNGVWDETRAYSIVKRANPTDDEKSLQMLTQLLLKIRATIVKFKLTVCVRTKYTRVALQSSTSDACRLTFDRDLVVINERGVAPSSSNSWCLEDHDTLSEFDIVNLPCNVYEVKIAGEDGKPSFVTELEDSQAIIEAQKFSKFLSGASIFNCDEVATLPWWSREANFAPLYSSQGLIADQDQSFASSQFHGGLDTESTGSFGASSQRSSEQLLGVESSCTIKNDSDSLGIPTRRTIMNQSLPRSISRSEANQQENTTSFQRRSVLLSKNDPASSKTKSKPIASKQRLRVEPKSHFANERTFIQWISAAFLIITFSQLLYILGSSNPAIEGQAAVAGTWMIAMSIFITVYALVIYYRRIYLMQNGKPYGYADFFGPGLLTVAVISGVALILVFSSNSRVEPSVMTSLSGQCVKRSLSGVPVMEMQPSGALVREEDGLLLVPSLNNIVAFEDGIPSGDKSEQQARIVANVGGANIEALEQVGNYIYALSEDTDKKSEIIAFELVDSFFYDTRLQETHRWEISLGGAEGMALVPEGQLGEGSAAKLLVAGMITERTSKGLVEVLSINVYDQDVFDFTQTKLDQTSKINRKLVVKGLNDEKVGSMQFFEGRLYVLFDNARVIRVFNPETGEITQDIPLPIAEVGAEKEWEGMRLQRIKTEAASHLRGTNDSIVLLHLTLDSPAQIWTIRLETGTEESIEMPTCTGAFNI